MSCLLFRHFARVRAYLSYLMCAKLHARKHTLEVGGGGVIPYI